jgi:hypothetical protein
LRPKSAKHPAEVKASGVADTAGALKSTSATLVRAEGILHHRARFQLPRGGMASRIEPLSADGFTDDKQGNLG